VAQTDAPRRLRKARKYKRWAIAGGFHNRSRSRLGLGYGISALHVCEGLLVNAGVWLYTRWSLTTPVIREESVGPLAATRRGRFWFVFMTATVAYYLEGVVIHESALVAGSVTGSHTWGAWTGGSIAATLVVPLAAFATSLAHSSVASRALPLA
jgi:hypothetical protein